MSYEFKVVDLPKHLVFNNVLCLSNKIYNSLSPYREKLYLDIVIKNDIRSNKITALVVHDENNELLDENTIGMSSSYKKHLGCVVGQIVKCYIANKLSITPIKNLFAQITSYKEMKKTIYLKEDDLNTKIDSVYDTIVDEKREFHLSINNITWTIQPAHIDLEKDYESTCGLLTNDTNIVLTGAQYRPNKLFKIDDTSFNQLGVGGVDTQFAEIVRRVFMTRMIPQSLYEKLGIIHTKAIILHGPPGTGKTRLARAMAQQLDCKSVTVVSGPQILDMYVGNSEKNVRNLFIKAEEDPDGLHVIILDEMEAISRARGGANNGIANDSIVNQLLAKIDGVESLNNIVIIGMTNRLDLIDKAMLRPGRFEVHLEIGLPDHIGRKQILLIHTKNLRENKILEDGIDFDQLATLTKNMTGAELEGIVKDATSRAFGHLVDMTNINKSLKKINDIIVTKDNLMQAIVNCKPLFGVSNDKLAAITKYPFDTFDSPEYDKLCTFINNDMKKFRESIKTHFKSLLIYGAQGSGKTYLAAHMAQLNKFTSAMYYSSHDSIRMTEFEKCNKLVDLIGDAHKPDECVVIIDDIDMLAEYTPPRNYSNRMVQTIKTILGTLAPNSKIYLILITNQFEDIKDTLIFNRIDTICEMPLINDKTIKQLINGRI